MLKMIRRKIIKLKIVFIQHSENCLIVFTSNSNVAVTVPRDSTDDLDDTEGGFITHIHQYSSGILTIGGEAGAVAFSYAQSLSTRKAGSALSLFKLEPDSWSVVGDQE
jgi:hypothetical protein